MRRRLATFVVVSALALGAAPAAAAGSPLTHMTFSDTPNPAAGGLTFADVMAPGAYCGATADPNVWLRHYTFTTGTMHWWTPNDANPPYSIAHFSISNAFATNDAGVTFRAVGTETYNGARGRMNLHIQLISKGGGVADTASFLIHSYADGTIHLDFDKGSCAP